MCVFCTVFYQSESSGLATVIIYHRMSEWVFSTLMISKGLLESSVLMRVHLGDYESNFTLFIFSLRFFECCDVSFFIWGNSESELESGILFLRLMVLNSQVYLALLSPRAYDWLWEWILVILWVMNFKKRGLLLVRRGIFLSEWTWKLLDHRLFLSEVIEIAQGLQAACGEFFLQGLYF